MKEQDRTLAIIPSARLERFLLELANLQGELGLDDHPTLRRFKERFDLFIPALHRTWAFDQQQFKKDEELRRAFPPMMQDRFVENIGVLLWVIPGLRQFIRRLWVEQDERQRDWAIFIIRWQIYSTSRDISLEREFLEINPDSEGFPRIPPLTPFEQALSYLDEHADQARVCPNPECPAPYFFVKRKNQRYCSEICAAPAQRELKRKWWAEHGEEWRAARKSKKHSKSKGEGKGERRGQKPTGKKTRKGGK